MAYNVLIIWLNQLTNEDNIPESWYYIKDSTGTQNKENNSKGSVTNSIDKCNLQIIYGNSRPKLNIISDISTKKVKYKQDLQK